jgi:hypothetical protein
MAFYDYFFETKRSRRLVFEVTTDGPEVAIDYLYILYRDQEDPLSSAEMEDLYHIGWVREDPAAAGGRAVALAAGVAPPISFPAGLRRYLPAGVWKVSLWYRLGEGPADGGQVEFREYGGPSLGRVFLGPGESKEGDYQAATVDLELDRGLFLDMEVTYSGLTDLLLDRVEVVGS